MVKLLQCGGLTYLFPNVSGTATFSELMCHRFHPEAFQYQDKRSTVRPPEWDYSRFYSNLLGLGVLGILLLFYYVFDESPLLITA